MQLLTTWEWLFIILGFYTAFIVIQTLIKLQENAAKNSTLVGESIPVREFTARRLAQGGRLLENSGRIVLAIDEYLIHLWILVKRFFLDFAGSIQELDYLAFAGIWHCPGKILASVRTIITAKEETHDRSSSL